MINYNQQIAKQTSNEDLRGVFGANSCLKQSRLQNDESPTFFYDFLLIFM